MKCHIFFTIIGALINLPINTYADRRSALENRRSAFDAFVNARRNAQNALAAQAQKVKNILGVVLPCEMENTAPANGFKKNNIMKIIKRREVSTKKGCRNYCQDVNNSRNRLTTCTHAYFGKIDHAELVEIESFSALLSLMGANYDFCILYNGPIEKRHDYNGGSIIPVNCDPRSKKEIQKKATAIWDPVITCSAQYSQNPEEVFTCEYQKKLGVSRKDITSKSETEGESAATELGLTVGVEAEDPLGVAKASMESSMRFNYGNSYEWTTKSEKQFTDDLTISNTVTVVASPGKVVTICQPVGTVGSYEIHANLFRRCNSDNCYNCDDDDEYDYEYHSYDDDDDEYDYEYESYDVDVDEYDYEYGYGYD